MRGGVLALAALSFVAAQPAQAACIDSPVASAARLHEFETMMLVVSLRCSRVGVDMRGNYDGLVASYRDHFESAATKLRVFFSALDGARKGSAYDRYTTQLANKYGGGSTSTENCHMMDGLTTEIVKARDGGPMLMAVANAMIQRSALETATCTTGVALRP